MLPPLQLDQPVPVPISSGLIIEAVMRASVTPITALVVKKLMGNRWRLSATLKRGVAETPTYTILLRKLGTIKILCITFGYQVRVFTHLRHVAGTVLQCKPREKSGLSPSRISAG